MISPSKSLTCLAYQEEAFQHYNLRNTKKINLEVSEIKHTNPNLNKSPGHYFNSLYYYGPTSIIYSNQRSCLQVKPNQPIISICCFIMLMLHIREMNCARRGSSCDFLFTVKGFSILVST